MPRRDLYHDTVIAALERDGWTITDDPLVLSYGKKDVYVDLGAEKMLGATKDGQEIAVEIKSFIGPSDVHDLHMAVGQYNVYRDILADTGSKRTLYLAVPRRAYEGIFADQLGQLVVERQELQVIVFGDDPEEKLEWISQIPT